MSEEATKGRKKAAADKPNPAAIVKSESAKPAKPAAAVVKGDTKKQFVWAKNEKGESVRKPITVTVQAVGRLISDGEKPAAKVSIVDGRAANSNE